MGISRREFVGWLAASGALAKSSLSFGWNSTPSAAPPSGFSILQGMTDETTAQFSVVLPKSQELRIEVSKSAVMSVPAVATRATSPFAVHKFTVDGLQLGEEYTLRIVNDSGEVKDERTFRALDRSPRPVKVAYLSCAMDHMHKADVWNVLGEQKPDVCFFLGDNVYADRKTLYEKVKDVDPVLLWDRYVQTRNKVSFYYQKQLIPVLAIWDDHDFGGNNSDKTYPFAAESHEIFETFFAQSSRPSLLTGPGIARRFDAFGADFWLLDDRTYRDAPDVNGSMWGIEQESWIEANLRPRASMMLNGSLFFGAYAEGLDSAEGQYATSFGALKDCLRTSGALSAFVSGDVHYSEIMKIEKEQVGHETFEIVASCIHSLTFPGIHDRYQNPRRVIADSTPNFILFDGRFSDNAINGDAICFTGSGEQYRAAVSALRG